MAQVNAVKVAEYILNTMGTITAMKLQKLVYYSQAWSLVWDETPLFNDKISAWANGPVVAALYHSHKGHFQVNEALLKAHVEAVDELNETQKSTVNRIIDFYGKHSAQWLSDLTHMETPWKLARRRDGAEDNERSSEEITLADMHEYYSGLLHECDAGVTKS